MLHYTEKLTRKFTFLRNVILYRAIFRFPYQRKLLPAEWTQSHLRPIVSGLRRQTFGGLVSFISFLENMGITVI